MKLDSELNCFRDLRRKVIEWMDVEQQCFDENTRKMNDNLAGHNRTTIYTLGKILDMIHEVQLRSDGVWL